MIVESLAIPEVRLLKPRIFHDNRGRFFEMWHQARYAEAGLSETFVQDNVSVSHRSVLRGLHFQQPNSQGKLVAALTGSVFDVAVDVRVGSPTFGQSVGAELSAENGHQLWVPAGFAHGFVVLSDAAVFAYKCTVPYSPSDERSIRWNDPALQIDWPVTQPILSGKDESAPLLSELDPALLPTFTR